MKFKSSTDNKKPWEKISLDEIQPYPSRYNKAIIIAYLFAFSVLFIKFMSVNSILEPFIPFIRLVVYGMFAFVIMKVVLRYTNESIISNILFILPIYTVFIILINIIFFLTLRIPFANVFPLFDPVIVLYAIVTYFYILFGLFGWYLSVYFLMSEHPKIQIHGFLVMILLIFYFISGNFLHL